MGNHSSSRFRREGRYAYYRGGIAEDHNPYTGINSWADEYHSKSWLEGWAEAAKADVDTPEVIDFEDVLRRYIDHVGQSEGANFINCLNDHTQSNVEFSQEEVATLERLADELV